MLAWNYGAALILDGMFESVAEFGFVSTTNLPPPDLPLLYPKYTSNPLVACGFWRESGAILRDCVCFHRTIGCRK